MNSQTKALPIAALQQRLSELHQQTAAARQRTLTEDEQGQLLEQLQFALRELSMAEEELRRQDEALARARRVAEEERRHFQRLFDLASDGYVITDLAGTIREVNRTAASLLRSEEEVLIGRSLSRFLPPTEQVTFFTRLMRLRTRAHTETWEMQLQPHPDHPALPLTVSATSERTEDGEVLYWILHSPAQHLREKSPSPAASVQGRTAAIRGITPTIQAEIEERQRTELALQESEGRYRELFENANDMITTIALDGTFLSVNRKAEQLLGYSREELIGQDSHKFATPASAAIGDERTRRVFAGELVPPIFALELVRRDGTIIPVEARIRIMRDQEGKPIGFHGIYRDVTERKRDEEALQAAHEELEDRVRARTEELVRANAALLAEVAERRRAEEAARAAEKEYRSIFENATEGIYRSSIDGHQIRANPALVKLNGYSSEAEQIASVNDIATEWYVAPNRRDDFKRLLEEHERVTNFESEIYRHKTRERIWISENARLVRDQAGTPLYYEGTVQDITARKQAEEALRRAHAELEQRVQERTAELTRTNAILLAEVAERQRTALALDRLRHQHESILNSAGEGIVGTDIEGRAIFVNPEAARLLNREVDEVVGHLLHLLLHHSKPNGAPYPVEECPFFATLREGQVVQVTDEMFWRKNGTAFPIEGLSTPIRGGDGNVIGAVITFRDITQRKEVDRMKDELIATVSHELRTPLTSLRGFAELLLERQFPLEKQQEFVTVIHKEALRLMTLVNDFLDLQRIKAGRQPYSFATVAVEPLVADIIALFTKEGNPHVFRLDLPLTLPPVRADAARLRQVLTNLLSNATKFSPQAGDVVVGARTEDGHVVMWVQDHGIGIPEEAFPKLFDKFYRVDNGETRHIGGTGLGLAIVKELITAHQGRVWVESQVGVGSTFFFTVPVAENRDE